MVIIRKNQRHADCWPPAVLKPKKLSMVSVIVYTDDALTNPPRMNLVGIASAPLSLKTVRAIGSSKARR